MKYLINNEVTFRTDDGVLASLSPSDNSLTLSITANRIFTYLLEQEGKVVSREEMFTNVWDKNGLQASNNSLSQYISLIRKGLQELGCEHEIIQTVPRVGFFIAEGLVTTIEETAFGFRGVPHSRKSHTFPVKTRKNDAACSWGRLIIHASLPSQHIV